MVIECCQISLQFRHNMDYIEQAARLVAPAVLIKGIFGITAHCISVFFNLPIWKLNVRPLTVITGILLGSCLAITVSLAAVLLVFLILGNEYPRVGHEFDALVTSVLIFFAMTIVCAGSFYSLLVNHRARFWLQLIMWGGVAATTWYYLP